MDFDFRMVTVAEFFQHPVIEFFIEKLGIIHCFIGKENAHGQENNSSHPHSRERLHHVFFHKFSSEIIQQKKYNKEYYGEDQGKTDAALANDERLLAFRQRMANDGPFFEGMFQHSIPF